MQSDYVTFLLEVYRNILDDISIRYPYLSKELERDYLRLCSVSQSRGLKFFTLDLPNLGKHFDSCLDSGRLTRSRLPGSLPSRRCGVIPRLFRGITLRVFEEDGSLRESVDANAVKCLRQLYNCSKKLKVKCDEYRTLKEVREFFNTDAEVRIGSLAWDSNTLGEGRTLRFRDSITSDCEVGIKDLPLFQEIEKEVVIEPLTNTSQPLCTGDYLDTLQCVCDIFMHFLSEFIPEEWVGRHGPGAVSDQEFGVSKYEFPNWPDKLAVVFPMDFFAFANSSIWADDVVQKDIVGRFSPHEPPNKLIAVPKTQKGPRLIASEPICYQWCQQAIRSYFLERISRSPLSGLIALRDQSRNQELARQASLTGGWTIDLSSASDRLSCWVVERCFRRNTDLLNALHATRSRWMYNPIDRKSPKFYKLRKFACMGSAVTFPVQTIVYAAVAVSAILYQRKIRPTIASVTSVCQGPGLGVFGDDIIVPADNQIGETVQEALIYLGFKINASKTFGKGNFRESCGADVFRGTNVTPIYITSLPERLRPESVIGSVEVSNNLARVGWYHTARSIKTTVIKEVGNFFPNLAADSGLLGWKHSDFESNDHLNSKWCHKLQKRLFQVLTPRSRCKSVQQRGSSSLLQYFTEAPKAITLWSSGIRTRPLVSLNKRWEELL